MVACIEISHTGAKENDQTAIDESWLDSILTTHTVYRFPVVD